MQKQAVFKVKGMQRDLSSANANQEFAYEILNMRLMPAEDLSGFSLTNEKGTTVAITDISGQVIGQCPTNDSLVVFTTDIVINEDGTQSKTDYIYEIYQTADGWDHNTLYSGNLNFDANKHIEALFNYETEDIQKVYWIDDLNQLRCINIATSDTDRSHWNDQSFDSIKEIASIPSVEIERVVGGSFTAGVIQYYVTYFNKYSSESPIVYTSPLLYIAHDSRGANVNDQVSTAIKLTFADLDTDNWEYMRIYVTHRTSIDATPEASIVTELNMNNSTIEFTDYGSNRTSIAPTDLYFTGGKFVKAGTMTVKDQVMFLGNLTITSPNTVDIVGIQDLFDSIRDRDNHPLSTITTKTKENNLEDYEETHYYYKNQLNNTESITHYKYGEKYRFGISVLDKYGNWSNPIWIKDAFIEVPPTQSNDNTLELPCPSLNLSYELTYNNKTKTLLEHLQDRGSIRIKPLIVFPSTDERKVIAQGAVCPTVYNLKDRKENGPYVQASWFMRPNVPADLWGISSFNFGKDAIELLKDTITVDNIWHKSDLITFDQADETLGVGKGTIISSYTQAAYFGASSTLKFSNGLSGYDYLYDDFSPYIVANNSAGENITDWRSYIKSFKPRNTTEDYYNGVILESTDWIDIDDQKTVYEKGTWLEFRHNYALKSKGWSFGTDQLVSWNTPFFIANGTSYGTVRGAELDVSRFDVIPPVNRFFDTEIKQDKITLLKKDIKPSQLYFCTVQSPREFAKSFQAGKRPSILVLYKYTDAEGKVYISNVQAIKMPKFDPEYQIMTEYIAPNQHLSIPEHLIASDIEGNNKWLRLKAKRNKSAVQLKPNGIFYYTWEVRDTSGITKTDYINNILKDGLSIFIDTDTSLKFGNTDSNLLSLGNSSYYVDNSIITLNSPEVELEDSNTILSNTNFRIVGMIPLTATASDISLEVTNPNWDPDGRGSGLIKRSYTNVNIGYHGFKGIVGSNAYLTNDSSDIETSYSLVQLSPWHSTGTLGRYNNTTEEFKSKDHLKHKVLSNLRYSVLSYFFKSNSINIKDNLGEEITKYNSDNYASINNAIIGWKPANGISADIYNGNDSSSIIKLADLGYTEKTLVYKGNIESLAMLTIGDTNSAVENLTYSFRHDPTIDSTDENTTLRMNSPAIGYLTDSTTYHKLSQGASIKYKSSPHYVIGFKCFDSLWKSTQKVQETLPALSKLNEEGISDIFVTEDSRLKWGRLYEDSNIASLYHQSYLNMSLQENYNEFENNSKYSLFRFINDPDNKENTLAVPNYGWLWLGEIYRETDPTFGGTSDYALQNNQWVNAGELQNTEGVTLDTSDTEVYNYRIEIQIDEQFAYEFFGESKVKIIANEEQPITFAGSGYMGDHNIHCSITLSTEAVNSIIDRIERAQFTPFSLDVTYADHLISPAHTSLTCTINRNENTSTDYPEYSLLFSNLPGDAFRTLRVLDIYYNTWPKTTALSPILRWTIGDTFYQRFDTLKTYAYSDSDQNSVIDITSFMVETRINIDGRYDRNRGQESNLQMSPTNFNLMNDVYSQRDNFFTYRILDEDLQARTNFPNQITWSLTKTAGAAVDAWMNITLASVLDLDGTKGELVALKNFNNNIIAFQEKGLSHIMFNSRAQIATSESVPIQIANTGKVDGQQYFTTDVGCQDKWNIVTTPNGLYFVDYFNKSIYRFNGKLEDISTPNGFRSWCYENLNSTANIIGYYDVKNKEVMYYIGDTDFKLDNDIKPTWLGFSELTGTFSSFYTYPKAWFANVQDQGLWLLLDKDYTKVYTHQTGNYNQLLNTGANYGLTVIPRQDSNTVKTFNNVEFRADSFDANGYNEFILPFDTISAETEYQERTPNQLSYSPYRPSNLKKKLRTWRANIPRVNNGYNRFVNQWAKIGLWKMDPNTEKTILHDLSVWYSE